MSVNKVFFHHIPKTGGNTMASYLRAFYPEERVLSARKIQDENMVEHRRFSAIEMDKLLSKTPKSFFNDFDFYVWHSTFRCAASKLPSDVRVVTLLREPLSWLISSFRHSSERPSARYYEEINEGGMGFVDFALNEQRLGYAHYLADMPICYDAAKEGRFILGLTSRMHESMMLAAAQLRFLPPPYFPQRKNPSVKSFSPPQSEVERAVLALRGDYEIYNEVESIFNRTWDQMSDRESCGFGFDSFGGIRDSYSNKVFFSADGSDSIWIGWHQLEKMGGKWSGPDCRSSIDFIVKKSRYRCIIKVKKYVNDAIAESLGVEFNGRIKKGKAVDEGVLVVLDENEINHLKYNRLVLGVSHTLLPAELPTPRGDRRKLGILVEGIELIEDNQPKEAP